MPPGGLGCARFASPSGTWYAAADDDEADRYWHRLEPIHTRAIITRDELAALPALLSGLDATNRTALLSDLRAVKAGIGPHARLDSVRPVGAQNRPLPHDRPPVDTTAAPASSGALRNEISPSAVAAINARLVAARGKR